MRYLFFRLGVAFAVLVFSSLAFSGEETVSLYDLKSSWRDVSGKTVQISVAKNHYALVTMAYTSCPHSCPMTISKMQEIETALRAEGLGDLKMVLASFDVKNDKPSKLQAFQTSRKLNPKHWILLSPDSEANARELAVALGITYKDIGKGDFSHSNIISLLDPNGVVVAKIDSLSASIDVFKSALEKKK